MVGKGIVIGLAVALFLILADRSDAYSFVVLDGNSQKVLLSKQANKRQAPASLTKMMTALVASERLRQDQIVTVGNYQAASDEQQIGLRAGEKMSSQDLLEAALINSANDAAVALADSSGNRSQFVQQMNRKARQLGLGDTLFKHPAGMDQPGQYTSALDMARLGRELMTKRRLSQIVADDQAWLLSGDNNRLISSTNRLLSSEVDGIKTGYTSRAGFSIATSQRRGPKWVVVAVLGASSSEQRFAAAARLMNRGLAMIKWRTAVKRNQLMAQVPVAYNRPANLVAEKKIKLLTANPEAIKVKLAGLPANISGDHQAGEKMGRVDIYLDGTKRASTPLILANNLKAPSLLQTLGANLPLLPAALLLILLALAYYWLRQLSPRRG